MKPFVKTIIPEKLSLNEFDAYLAEGYFPSGQSMQALSHWVMQHLWILEINRVYRMRFSVDDIVKHKSHQRVSKLNRGFRVEFNDFNEILQVHNELYQKYREYIKFECASSIQEILEENTYTDSIYKRIVISVYDNDKLIAMDILCAGVQSLASVLCFFDPDYAKYSLGKYSMLLAIEYMKLNGYTYYYLGYLMNGNPKFDYKLFLGADGAAVFNVENSCWVKFDSSILIPINYTEEEKMGIAIEINGFYSA
jgi:hypothetical protein